MTIDESITLLKFNNKHIADLKNDDLQQLAEWLEELKSYRAHIFSGDMTRKMLKEAYNKAIDDYMNKLCNHCMKETNECNKLECPFCTDGCDIVKIAEQLKAGGENEQSI